MNSKKFLALALVCVMLFGVLAGCTSDAPPAESEAPAESAAPVESEAPVEGELVDFAVCLASEPAYIDPALSSAVDSSIMIQHFFEGLMTWDDSGVALNDKGNVNKAELVMGQAESYEKTVNDDGSVTYTFTLRDDIMWSNGEPVTAADFVYSWQRLANPLTGADYSYMIAMVKGWDEVQAGEDVSMLGVSAPDERTFVVDIVADTPYFLEICAFPATVPVNQTVVDASPDTWTTENDSANYISNGAWVLSEWVHDSYIRAVPNEYYYGVDLLVPDTLTFQLMNDQNAMLAGLRAGDLQFINEVPVDEIAPMLAAGELDIAEYIGTYYVSYQVEKEPFDDPLVRQAFTLAINSQYIVTQVTQGGQVPAAGFVPSGIYDADPTGDDFRTVGGDYYDVPLDDATYEANLARAKELMAEAGYPNGEGFPVVTYLYNTNDSHQAVGEALQQMWGELGVTVQLQNQEWNAFLESRKNGDFQIARNGWIADYNDPMSFLDMWITGSGNNDAQYSNPEYDALIAEATATSDPVARMELLHQAEDLMMGTDWLLAPIYFYTQTYVVDEGFGGLYYTPLGYFIFDQAGAAS